MTKYVVLALFAGLVLVTAQIKQVTSWDDFRASRKSQGKTDAEIDAEVSEALAALRTMDRNAGDDRLGVTPPPFEFEQWLNSKPLSLENLRGSVVLLRWWTDTCPLCASTAPALRKLHDQYSSRGLKVIAVYHPKEGLEKPLDLERVQRAVEARQFSFPVAIDWKWRTLRTWWLSTSPIKRTRPGSDVPRPWRPATSVTLMLDKNGVIRHVHPGMEYHDGPSSEEHAVCENDMASIRRAIERLISEL